jgi:NAD(P)H-flavin reductase/Fe-S-cluster-containing hydrogenase component 2
VVSRGAVAAGGSPAGGAIGDADAGAHPVFLPRGGLDGLITALREGGHRVIGPVVADGAIILDEVAAAADLPVGIATETAPATYRIGRRDDGRVFDHVPGPVSPKRWMFPPLVTQARWESGEDGALSTVTPPAPPLALLGIRACEIAAIGVQDRVLLGGPVTDPDYRARREGALVVAVECAVAGSTCFCTSMGTGPEVRDGFDLALTELDDGFVVRVGSEAGAELVRGLDLLPATSDQLTGAGETVAAARRTMGEPMPMEGLPERLVAAADSPRWAEIAERCLACANCTLVCPTCFCTSAHQRSDLDGAGASVDRQWDSCFPLDFARVAGGNFRPQPKDRYRQWLTHKFGTWWDQFGTSGCVGCGRCIAWCPVGIDVREELQAVAGLPPEAPATLPDLLRQTLPMAPQSAVGPGPAGDGETWATARVVESRRETSDVVSLHLQTDDPALLAGRPGQFVMAALPGLAAPPISISRFLPDGLVLTVRAAGPATTAITRLGRGESIALRGPLGRGWPVEQAAGRDVLVITGGIGLAPLRPLLDALLANRVRFGEIRLAYGARTPRDRLFIDELDVLARRPDMAVDVIVDRAGPEWFGRVGVVTQLIDRAPFDGPSTVAFVCGPERMMEATADVLAQRGVTPDRVFVTLERHMDCGVGLCGHCQLGKRFVCRDGPVFSLEELGPDFRLEGR